MNVSRSRAGLVIAACSVALLAPLLYPLLTGRVLVYNDVSWFHLPLRYLYRQALRAGDSVLWTPSIFAGFYLHGELPLPSARDGVQPRDRRQLHGGVRGDVLALLRLRVSRAAALFGAMLFAFSGFNCCTTITSAWPSSRTGRGRTNRIQPAEPFPDVVATSRVMD